MLAAGIGALAAWAFVEHEVKLSPIAHTMIGVALGLLLVFRTNASYDRYWEGRRLLGGMVIRIRDLTRQLVASTSDAEREAVRHARNLACAYYRLAAQSLRGEKDLASLAKLLTEEERKALEPVSARVPVVSTWLSRVLVGLRRRDAISDAQLLAMDQGLTSLTESFAGCERILRTPVPFAYAQHIKIFVTIFCFTAPFAISEAMKWYTPVAAALLAFALFGIDEIGVEIEDPFGHDENDLPVDAIGDGIEKATSEMLEFGGRSGA